MYILVLIYMSTLHVMLILTNNVRPLKVLGADLGYILSLWKGPLQGNKTGLFTFCLITVLLLMCQMWQDVYLAKGELQKTEVCIGGGLATKYFCPVRSRPTNHNRSFKMRRDIR